MITGAQQLKMAKRKENMPVLTRSLKTSHRYRAWRGNGLCQIEASCATLYKIDSRRQILGWMPEWPQRVFARAI